jgi:hypothetical protein
MISVMSILLITLLKHLKEIESEEHHEEIKSGKCRDYSDFFPNYELTTLQVSQEYRRHMIRKTVSCMKTLSKSAKHG